MSTDTTGEGATTTPWGLPSHPPTPQTMPPQTMPCQSGNLLWQGLGQLLLYRASGCWRCTEEEPEDRDDRGLAGAQIIWPGPSGSF